MLYFSLNLETISPLAIRSDHAPTRAESANYISGTALAGSLAAVYRLYYQQNSDLFEQLFLSGQVYYPDLYPATFGSIEMQRAINAPVYALPKTAQSCKRFSGFVPLDDEDVEKDDRHGVRDTLLDWAAFELGNSAWKRGEKSEPVDAADLLAPLLTHKICEYNGTCEKPMDHFDGYYRRSENGKFAKAEVEKRKRLQTHTGINRDTGTVQEGILYNRSVFQEHTLFWGLLKIPEHLAEPLHTFIEEVGLSGLLRVGTGRTRGMGRVNLSIEPLETAKSNIGTFKENLETFNDKLKQVAKDWFPESKYNFTLAPFYFALTLHSPVILRDSLLRYARTLDAKILANLLDSTIPNDTFKLVYQVASTKRVTGWNELWGTPRTNEFAIDTGSVFLFSSAVEMNEQLCEALFKLEEDGIGERKAEGFGLVRISDPFHLEDKPL
jgi:CRISPR-associated protein Csx10